MDLNAKTEQQALNIGHFQFGYRKTSPRTTGRKLILNIFK